LKNCIASNANPVASDRKVVVAVITATVATGLSKRIVINIAEEINNDFI
jgi:hypothetical protein